MNIINKAKSENRSKKDAYYEKHHILPKSIYPRWINRETNMVLLTAREHFFVHLLLMKIYENDPVNFKKMSYAANRFQKSKHADYKITSKEYEIIKENLAKATSLQFKNKKQTKEHIAKRIESLKKTRQKNKIHWSEEHRKKTKKWFEENKEILSEKQKEGWTDEVRKKFSDSKKEYFKSLKENNPNYWKEHQKEICNTKKAKENMKNGKLGKIIVNNGIISKYVYPDQIPEGFIKGRLSK